MANPTLKTAWDKQAELLSVRADEMHTEDGHLAKCKFNAAVFIEHVRKAFMDAGYMPMTLLLGTIVEPVIEAGPMCITCTQQALLAVPGVAERFADEEAEGHKDGLDAEEDARQDMEDREREASYRMALREAEDEPLENLEAAARIYDSVAAGNCPSCGGPMTSDGTCYGEAW